MDLVENQVFFKKQYNISGSKLELYVRVYYLYNNSIQNGGRIAQWRRALLKG